MTEASSTRVTLAASVNWLVGERVRSRRLRRQWRQQDLADRMRYNAGLAWTRLTVASVERGDREVHLHELAGLCGVFGLPVGAFLSPGADEAVLVAEGSEVAWADVVVEVEGGLRYGWGGLLDTLKAEGPLDMVGFAVGGAPQVVSSTDETDTKAAKVLQRPVSDVQDLASDLWGRSLSSERDRRLAEREHEDGATADEEVVSPRTLQARRGRMTRTLLLEMRAAFSDPEMRAERRAARYSTPDVLVRVGSRAPVSDAPSSASAV